MIFIVTMLSIVISANAETVRTARVNGLTWKYVVVDGTATIFGGQFREWDGEEGEYVWAFNPAIPQNTSGDIVVPSSLGGYSVRAIGNGAFCECGNLKSVTIPDGVTSIGEEAFTDCEGMVSVYIPEGVVTIAKDAFDGCISLSSIKLPESLTVIGSRAFDDCWGLQYVEIPPTVTSIGYHAFCRCYNLQTANVPETLEQQVWGNGVFDNCPQISIDFYEFSPGNIVVYASEGNVAGDEVVVTVRREGGSDGRVAVKLKTQDSATVGGINGVSGRDFQYVKEYLVWEDGDASDRVVNIPTYISDANGDVTFRVKLSVQTTGVYAGCVTPALDGGGKKIVSFTALPKGTIVMESSDGEGFWSVAGKSIAVKISRVGGSAGRVAVKFKTQDAATVGGINGMSGRDFQYVKEYFVWEDGDTSDRIVEVPTYAAWWDGEPRTFRLKVSAQTTGDYDGCVTPALADGGKVIASIQPDEARCPGAVYIKSVESVGCCHYSIPLLEPPFWGYAGDTLRVTVCRDGGDFGRIAVKLKTQDAATVGGINGLSAKDITYTKETFVWEDGETEDKVLEIPTFRASRVSYPRTFRLKFSAMTTGDYEDCLVPALPNPKVIVSLDKE